MRFVAAIVDGVVVAEADEVLADAEEFDLAVLHEEEREVFGHQRPFVGRALEVDDLVFAGIVDGVGHDRAAGGRRSSADRARQHQIHRGAPVELVGEHLEDQALCHASSLFFQRSLR